MTRHETRELALHIIFGIDLFDGTCEQLLETRLDRQTFSRNAEEYPLYGKKPGRKDLEYIRRAVSGVYSKKQELDGYIKKYAVSWSIDRISKVTIAILRLALYECKYMEDVPVSAAINEAVELAKAYDEQDAASFVNGVLGGFSRNELCAENKSASDSAEREQTEITVSAGDECRETEDISEGKD